MSNFTLESFFSTCIEDGCGEKPFIHLRCIKHATKHFPDIKQGVRKVDQEIKRAAKKGCEATLTIEQWIGTEEYFLTLAYNCVYCGRLFAVGDISIEHWRPITLGGGTTQVNCVPACSTCNMLKSTLTGDEFFNLLITVYKSSTAPKLYNEAKRYFQWVSEGCPSIREWHGEKAKTVSEVLEYAKSLGFYRP